MAGGAPIAAVQFAQMRRDEETKARESLKSLIPDDYFRPEIENSGNYNVTTKVLKAAEHYIHAQAQEKGNVAMNQPTSPVRSPEGKGKGKEREWDSPARPQDRSAIEEGRHHDMIRGQAMTTALPSPFVNEIEEIRQLRQASRRLVQVAEGKADSEGGLSEELKQSIDQGSDLLIDLIKVIEQGAWMDEQKRKWEEENAKWARKVNVD